MRPTCGVFNLVDTGAEFSDCRKYRYKLWRTWDSKQPKLYFILMNPSTADEFKNDPTIERQCRRARKLGFGGLVILNCGAIRETDSKRAWADEDPIGPKNLEIIRNEVLRNQRNVFVAGWGKPAHQSGIADKVLDIFRDTGTALWCLGKNSDGSPKHPLYVSYEQPLELYEGLKSLRGSGG